MPLPFSAHGAWLARVARNAVVCLGQGGAVGLVAFGLSGCGDEAPLMQAFEDFRVVRGDPRAEFAPPVVHEADPVPGGYRPSRPRRCDWFQQEPERPVDILVVVDNSASMAGEQAKLKSAIGSLVAGLVQAEPPFDFHFGVVTTDIDSDAGAAGADPASRGPGRLRRVPGGTAHYVACAPGPGGVRCNVGDGAASSALAAIQALLDVGTGGSTSEKGLLAAMRALSEPLRSTENAGFLRAEAALSLVFVSDEEDSSCGPYVEAAPCLASPSCKCEDSPAWGSVDYYRRFFRGLKGFGNEDAVRIAAIVAGNEVDLVFGDNTGRTYRGCTASGDASDPCFVPNEPGGAGPGGVAECAFWAPRYAAVAAASGGGVVDICADDYTSALAELGLEGSGLRSEFPLGRPAVCGTIDVVVVPNPHILCDDEASCPGESPECVNRDGKHVCGKRIPGGLPEGWEYVICSGGTQRNVVRFSGRSIPEPLHEVEVCYDVDVGHDS